MDRMAQTFATEGGRLLTFAEWGAHDGVPIFSMHGTPGCRLPSRRRIENGWAAVLDELGVRVITHDRPGYGGSDRQPGRSVADTAADVAAIAGALGIDRFAVEGGSSGSAHALAVAAQLGSRVRRVAVTAPMAPYVVLGPVEWSAGQDAEVQSYVAACLQGEESAKRLLTTEDEVSRQGADESDPADASVFEATRGGIWGWVDDELGVLRPWGFDASVIRVPCAIWYDPEETILPAQHAAWVHRTVAGSILMTTTALGHRNLGDPRHDWIQLYAWLNEGA